MGLIRVLLADSHLMLHNSIRTALSKTDDITLMGEVIDGHDIQHFCQKYPPDVLLLATTITDPPLATMLHFVKQQCETIKVLVLTNNCDEVCVQNLIACGALGCILKHETVEMLVDAIRTVAQSKLWFSPLLLQEIIHPEETTLLEANGWTKRELAVLQLLVTGKTNWNMACALNVSKRTISHDLEHIYEKLGVNSRAGAAAQTVRLGLVE